MSIDPLKIQFKCEANVHKMIKKLPSVGLNQGDFMHQLTTCLRLGNGGLKILLEFKYKF